MSILVTGVAGFIGQAVAKALLLKGHSVIGIDNLNSYYDVKLKELRLQELRDYPNFAFHRCDINEPDKIKAIGDQADIVLHLAAQAGVRYSLENPMAYIQSNIVGFLNILELCRHSPKKPKLVYASSSSVYGANDKIPFSTNDEVKQPVSLYAATKLADEHMAYCYHHLYGINTIGLRFFTVYGELGRPDMAPYKFTQAILANEEIDVYNHGKMKRDFTYIDDIVAGVIAALEKPLKGNKIYNLGNHHPIELLYFIELIEKETGMKARMNLLPMQPGEVTETYADITEAVRDLGFSPKTSIEVGVKKLVAWMKNFS
jgi:UDP-glucuronate 4-epimerase